MKKLLFSTGLLLVLISYLFGWWPGDRHWQTASGWNKIALENHPPGGVSTRLFKEAEDPCITWLGHAGFWIQWNGQSILLDPNFQNRLTLSRRFITAPPLPGNTPIDLVCISHAHFDHLSPATLKKFPGIKKVILPKGSEVYLEEKLPGQPALEGLAVWGTTRVGPLTVTAVPARHNGCRYHPWSSRYIAVGYVISDGERSFYFAGDTAYQPEVFNAIKERLHPDTAILPIGAYAPRMPFKIHHMDPTEAIQAGQDLAVSQVIPCHFGTYRVTLDVPSRALPRFAAEAAKKHLYWSMPAYYE